MTPTQTRPSTESSARPDLSEAAAVRAANSEKGATATAQRVPVNMYETDDALVIVAPLPGVMPDDVEILIAPGHVRIEARLRAGAGKDYLLEEWTYGPYTRIVDIPTGWGATGQATLANGQLALRLLKGDPGEGAVVAVRPGE